MPALAIGLLCLALAGDPAEWTLAIGPARRIHATYTQTIHLPRCAADEWEFFAAVPPELPGQSDTRVEIEPHGRSLVERSPLRRPIVRSRLRVGDGAGAAASRHDLTIRVRLEATLNARRLVRRSHTFAGQTGDDETPAPALSAAERELALRSTAMIDHAAPEFRTWLDGEGLRRRAGESDLDLARRVYRFITGRFAYDYRPAMNRRASFVCGEKSADCGGLSVLFVSILRANDVPARLLVGRWAKSAVGGERMGAVEYLQQHARAELFLAGVGWVPADPSQEILHGRGKTGLEHFGADRGRLLVLHVDPEMLIDTAHFGRQTVDWLQGACFWVSGRGTLDGMEVTETWVVTDPEPAGGQDAGAR